MKRVLFAAFCILALCSLLAINTGTVKAYKTGYDVNDYMIMTLPTMDGTWTSTDEWNDTEVDVRQLEGGINATFRLKYDSAYPDWVNQYFLIEIFGDNTTDSGDYWQICYASGATFQTDPIGGTTPQTDCLKFEFTGHGNASSGLTVSQGNGTGWAAGPAFVWPDDVQVVSYIGPSPLDSKPHCIFEIKIEHVQFVIQPNFWIYVAVHDTSNATAVQSWPSGSSSTPNDWGLMNAPQSQKPEALTIGMVVLLSSVAVVVSFYWLRKHPKTESYSAEKISYTL